MPPQARPRRPSTRAGPHSGSSRTAAPRATRPGRAETRRGRRRRTRLSCATAGRGTRTPCSDRELDQRHASGRFRRGCRGHRGDRTDVCASVADYERLARMRTPDARLGSGQSAGRTTEVVREAEAEKERAGVLGGPKPGLRPLASRSRQRAETWEARDPVVLSVSRLPFLPSWSPVPSLGGGELPPRELSTLSAQNTPSGQAPTVRPMRDESGS